MPLSYGPEAQTVYPKSVEHVKVLNEKGEEAELTEPIQLDEARRVSFTVAEPGLYYIHSDNGHGAVSKKSIYLHLDPYNIDDYADIRQRADAALEGVGGGGGAVSSVNGQTGEVVLTSEDFTVEADGTTYDLQWFAETVFDTISHLMQGVDSSITQVLYFIDGGWRLGNGYRIREDDWDIINLPPPVLWVGGNASDLPTRFNSEEHIHISQEILDGGGAVVSVNGKTGEVVLSPEDVGAQPAGSYAAADHTHPEYENPDLSGYVQTSDSRLTDARTPTAHNHTISDVTGLQSALDGKQASGSYAAETHTHSMEQVAGLNDALDGKQDAGNYAPAEHSHDGDYLPASWTPDIADLPAGSIIRVLAPTGTRPTSRTDVTVWWIGHTTQPGGALQNDVWLEPTE